MYPVLLSNGHKKTTVESGVLAPFVGVRIPSLECVKGKARIIVWLLSVKTVIIFLCMVLSSVQSKPPDL